jgi:hypothetical protein
MKLTTGALVSQAISVAATLGVADQLACGPRPVDEVARAVGAHAPTSYRLLRALSDVEVFRELDGRRFGSTPVGDLLRSDAPGSVRSWATMVGLPFNRSALAALLESVRTGEPAFERVHGRSMFAYFAGSSTTCPTSSPPRGGCWRTPASATAATVSAASSSTPCPPVAMPTCSRTSSTTATTNAPTDPGQLRSRRRGAWARARCRGAAPGRDGTVSGQVDGPCHACGHP